MYLFVFPVLTDILILLYFRYILLKNPLPSEEIYFEADQHFLCFFQLEILFPFFDVIAILIKKSASKGLND